MNSSSNSQRIKDSIRYWAVSKHPAIEGDGCLAPELKRGYNPCIIGMNSEGKSITTSLIKGIENRIVITKSGSRYILVGDPAKEYLKFLEDNQLPYVEDKPLDCLIGLFIKV